MLNPFFSPFWCWSQPLSVQGTHQITQGLGSHPLRQGPGRGRSRLLGAGRAGHAGRRPRPLGIGVLRMTAVKSFMPEIPILDGYPLAICHWKWPIYNLFPYYRWWILRSYVNLPEGKSHIIHQSGWRNHPFSAVQRPEPCCLQSPSTIRWCSQWNWRCDTIYCRVIPNIYVIHILMVSIYDSIYIFSAAICSSCRTTRQQQLSVSRMETQYEKKKKQENLWLQDKLLTSTFNTGPDGFV